MGNDQHELFDDSVTPAFTVFWGDKIENVPRSKDQIARLPAGIHIADHGHVPPRTEIYPGAPELGLRIIEHTIADDFDVAHSVCTRSIRSTVSSAAFPMLTGLFIARS